MKKRHWPLTPLILGIILGPMLEQSLRQSLELSAGSPAILVTRPIAVLLLLFTAAMLTFVRRAFVKPELAAAK